MGGDTEFVGSTYHMLRRFIFLLLVWVGTCARAAPPVDISEFHGRVLYLDFWASWCAPCQQSFPWMQTMQQSHESEGLAIVAVNLDSHRPDADRFLAKLQPTFDIRFDPQGEMAQRFHIHGMPTSLIIDRKGAVRFTHIGFRPIDGALFEEQLRQVLAEQ